MNQNDETAARRATLEFAAVGRIAAGAAYELDPPPARILIHLRMLIEESVTANDGAHGAAPAHDRGSGPDRRDGPRSPRVHVGRRQRPGSRRPRGDRDRGSPRDARDRRARALVRRYRHVPRVRGHLGRLTQVLTSVLGNAAVDSAIDPARQHDRDRDRPRRRGAGHHRPRRHGRGHRAERSPLRLRPVLHHEAGGRLAGAGLAAARFALLEMGGGSPSRARPVVAATSASRFGHRERRGAAPPRVREQDGPVAPGPLRRGDVGRRQAPRRPRSRRRGRGALRPLERRARATRAGRIIRPWSSARAEGARRVGFRERLAHVAPDVLPRTFAVMLRSSASHLCARARPERRARMGRAGRRPGRRRRGRCPVEDGRVTARSCGTHRV